MGLWSGCSSAVEKQIIVGDSYFLSEEADLMAESEEGENIKCL